MEMSLSLEKLMEYEKKTNRVSCPNILPYENFQDPFFSPEKGNIFDIQSYWVEKGNFYFFETETILKDIFLKKNKVLFLIHPESNFFYEYLDKSNKGPVFKAISTSSSRTVLLFYNEKPLCFSKLSLDKEIGGSVRTIPLGETIRSIGTTIVLDELKNKKKLPHNFNYFREVISVIPKEKERGGMIIREIPEDLLKDDFHLIPVFSLFTVQKNEQIPLFTMSKGQDLEKFIYSNIFVPFIDQYFILGKLGISMEPHSQNLLINFEDEIKFFHRDFGGFNLNLKKHNDCKIPFLKNIREEYFQDEHEKHLCQSLFIYFEGGVIHGLSKISKISYDRLKFLFRYYIKQKLLFNGIRTNNENLEKKIIFFFTN